MRWGLDRRRAGVNWRERRPGVPARPGRQRDLITAEECLQSAEVCLALAHKTKKLDTRAALLEFAYEFRTVAKRLECVTSAS
jgi:hypothetical protein